MGSSCVKSNVETEIHLERGADITPGIETPQALEEKFLLAIGSVKSPIEEVNLKREQMATFKYNTSAEISFLVIASGEKNAEGDTYYGYWHTFNKTREYKGVILYKDGSIYEGHFSNQLPTGNGRLILSHLGVYEGNFLNGKFHGEGKYTTKDGDYYKGEWKEGIKHGHAEEAFKMGEIYCGDYVNGEKTGHGNWLFQGNSYDGDFVKGKRHGQGTYSWKKGKKYVGQWVDDLEEGEGALYYSNGVQFKGKFSQGQKEGAGKLIFPDGAELAGVWAKDKRNGIYILTVAPTAAPIQTQWEDNKFIKAIGESAGVGESKISPYIGNFN